MRIVRSPTTLKPRTHLHFVASHNRVVVRLWLRLVDPAIAGAVDRTVITYDDLQSEDYVKLNPLRERPRPEFLGGRLDG